MEVRFWQRIKKTPSCWIWTGTRHDYGYGQIGGRRDEGVKFAHRLSWEIHFGPIPEGMEVLHRCDNPPCVRPEHLFLGTKADNNADCRSKGRHGYGTSPGELNPSRKLSERQVAEIRELYAGGAFTQQALADRFGMSHQMIHNIVRGKAWRSAA